jgi:hypothetical protein
MIFPIIMITICAALGGGAFLFIKISEKKKKQLFHIDEEQKTANEFINVKDIKGKFLYTRDGLILCYLKINSISIDLFSKSEKGNIIKQLTANMSSIQYPFKFIAVSRPVDISPLIAELSELLKTSDPKQKELLKQEIIEMSTFALSGEVVERQFYVVVWDKLEEGAKKDLLMKAKEFASNFTDNGIGCDILEQQDIVRLCNLINNPAYMHLEDTDFEPSIPILSGGVAI